MIKSSGAGSSTAIPSTATASAGAPQPTANSSASGAAATPGRRDLQQEADRLATLLEDQPDEGAGKATAATHDGAKPPSPLALGGASAHPPAAASVEAPANATALQPLLGNTVTPSAPGAAGAFSAPLLDGVNPHAANPHAANPHAANPHAANPRALGSAPLAAGSHLAPSPTDQYPLQDDDITPSLQAGLPTQGQGSVGAVASATSSSLPSGAGNAPAASAVGVTAPPASAQAQPPRIDGHPSSKGALQADSGHAKGELPTKGDATPPPPLTTPGDAILRQLQGGSPAAIRTDTTPRDLSSLVDQLAQRVLVSDPRSGSNEVRITLDKNLLDGAEIRFSRSGNGLNIEFVTTTPESLQRLTTARSDLARGLGEKLGEPVTVSVQDSGGDMEGSGDQRGGSRQRQRVIDAWHEGLS